MPHKAQVLFGIICEECLLPRRASKHLGYSCRGRSLLVSLAILQNLILVLLLRSKARSGPDIPGIRLMNSGTVSNLFDWQSSPCSMRLQSVIHKYITDEQPAWSLDHSIWCNTRATSIHGILRSDIFAQRSLVLGWLHLLRACNLDEELRTRIEASVITNRPIHTCWFREIKASMLRSRCIVPYSKKCNVIILRNRP